MVTPLRVVTANVRKADADDGPDGWDHRKAFCSRLITEAGAHLLGVQEARRWQQADLAANLPHHDWHGLVRTPDDGHPINAVAWDRRQLQLVSAGGYWLSETPHLPGSRSWGSASIRLANWVLLASDNDGPLRFINTHLDHISATARQQGLAMIAADAAAWPNHLPQVLTMDANAQAQDPIFDRLRQSGWRDAWAEADGPEAINTAHEFLGHACPGGGGRIDHCWVRGPIHGQAARLMDEADPATGRWPSDHYFLAVDLVTARP